jgi:hypothetical protein
VEIDRVGKAAAAGVFEATKFSLNRVAVPEGIPRVKRLLKSALELAHHKDTSIARMSEPGEDLTDPMAV